nr:MAG TPA: hypothetical protein [Caudoviricetes sp.]
MARKSFVFRLEWFKSLSAYPAEVRLEVYEATMRYALSGTLSELKPLSSMAFTFIKNALDADFEKYNDISDKRRAAGQKGRAIASKCKQMISSEQMISQEQMISENVLLYDTDTVSDTDTPCVCDGSAPVRAASHDTTAHNDFEFFFPTFWMRNIIAPEAETRRFIDYYEASGWALEKGAVLDTDSKRLAKARQWKPEKPGKRFPEDFLKVWWQLAQAAPTEGIRGQMLCDRVAVDMTGTEPVVRIGEATHAWIMGEGRSIAEKALAGDWLKGRVRLKFRAF